ncbi:MAG: hypothetical protein M3Y37_04395 [Chloroflexota bacterium]|nr:hypothetical protein [Chloroflexota bacterium]
MPGMMWDDERESERDSETGDGAPRELTEAEKAAIERMGDRELREFIARLQGRSPGPIRRLVEE